jgi:hypothetical protein
MLHTYLSSGVGTVGQLVADVPSGLSLIPPHETINKYIYIYNVFILHIGSMYRLKLSSVFSGSCYGLVRCSSGVSCSNSARNRARFSAFVVLCRYRHCNGPLNLPSCLAECPKYYFRLNSESGYGTWNLIGNK